MANSKRLCKSCMEYYRVQPGHPKFRKWCSDECRDKLAIKLLIETREKQTKAWLKQKQKRKKAAKKDLLDFNKNTLSWQKAHTQTVFNKMRVLEEKLWFYSNGLESECISCGKTNMDWCCGHFKTRGSQSYLRYDRKNTYLQCNRYCNQALSGNIGGTKTTRGYKKGLFERFGEEKCREIIEYCETNTRTATWTCGELEKMRKEFNKEIRRLNKTLVL